MAQRLSTVAPDLVTEISRMPEGRLRELASGIADAAGRETQLDDPRFRAALAILQSDRSDEAAVRAGVETLVQELDEVAWDIQDKLDSGEGTYDQYSRAFDRARAAAAAYWALDSDPEVAALESAYEASIVLQSRIQDVVADILGSS